MWVVEEKHQPSVRTYRSPVKTFSGGGVGLTRSRYAGVPGAK
jgi:hypothetical protein